jgi:segregation and condensation protein B
MPISDEQLKQILEAALMAAGEPLTIDKMLALFVEDKEPPTRDAVKAAIKQIEEESEARGIELKKVSSGYRFQAKKDFSQWVSRLWEEKPARYSRALLETLVLIAYKQPITRGEVEQVRGVAVSTNIIKTLLERDWVKVVGHREVPGRPALYSTTKAFLDYFNLKSLDELPTLAEIRDLDTIKPELELDLQEPGVESALDSSAEDVNEIEDVSPEEVAEMDANEASEEEIDVNIEDTDNIRGTLESSATAAEIVGEAGEEDYSEDDESLEAVAVAEEVAGMDANEVPEEDTDVNIEETDNIRESSESAAIDEGNIDETGEEDYSEDDESLETVTVSEDVDDEYSEADEVDSKFGG